MVRWRRGDSRMESQARSRDLSSRGVYFHLQEEVSNQTSIEVVLSLPGELSPGSPVKVRCHGRVVRVQRQEQGVAVAVEIDRYEFLRRGAGTIGGISCQA